MRDRDGHPHQDQGARSGGATGRLRGGGYVAPSRAVALTGAPPPQGQQARSRRSAVPAVTLRRCSRLQRPGLARPPCRAFSRRARSQSRALPPVASAMAQAPPLTVIFPGKTSAPIGRTG
jgi:hypothetical protein